MGEVELESAVALFFRCIRNFGSEIRIGNRAFVRVRHSPPPPLLPDPNRTKLTRRSDTGSLRYRVRPSVRQSVSALVQVE